MKKIILGSFAIFAFGMNAFALEKVSEKSSTKEDGTELNSEPRVCNVEIETTTKSGHTYTTSKTVLRGNFKTCQDLVNHMNKKFNEKTSQRTLQP